MNENLPKEVQTIPLDAVIDIKIGGSFYSRLHQLLNWYAKQKDIPEFTKEIASLRADVPPTEYAYHLETIITLIREVELRAAEQGKIKTIETEKIIKKEV